MNYATGLNRASKPALAYDNRPVQAIPARGGGPLFPAPAHPTGDSV
jgi:hypothetical protein